MTEKTTDPRGSLPALDTAAVGAPITRLNVSFHPIYLQGNDLPEIRTGEGAGLVVKELDREQVNTVRAANPTETPILLVEGEHFVGGMQNRVVNGSLLLAPGAALDVPVTCLEAGRWGYGRRAPRRVGAAPPERDPAPGVAPDEAAPDDPAPDDPEEDRRFRAGAAKAPRRLRRVVVGAVSDSLREERGHASDQGAAWGEVDDLMAAYGARSASSSAAEAERVVFERDRGRGRAVDELTARGPLPGQCGVAVTHGERVVSVEVFGAPGLLAAHWGSLVRSHLLERPERPGQPSTTRALWGVRRPTWMPLRRNPGLGLGVEFHAKDERLVHHALTLDGRLVHAATQFAG